MNSIEFSPMSGGRPMGKTIWEIKELKEYLSKNLLAF